jgi:hypothetical protein
MSDDLKKRLRDWEMWDEGDINDAREEAHAYIEELEGKLAKLTKAATKVHTSYWYSTDGVITGMYELEQALRIAELKGKTDD